MDKLGCHKCSEKPTVLAFKKFLKIAYDAKKITPLGQKES